MKLSFPNPMDHSSCSEFFEYFVEVNGEQWSQREISAHLEWPTSFLPDLIKKRKNLTLLRAMEFSEKADFSPTETEHLLFLGFRESLPGKYGDFFSPSLYEIESEAKADFPWWKIIDSIADVAVIELLRWKKTGLSPGEIVGLLPTFDLKESEVSGLLERLIDSGVIRSEREKVSVIDLEPKLINLNSAAQSRNTKASAQSMINFLDNPSGPCFLNSAVVEIPEPLVESFKEKLCSMTLWMRKRIRQYKDEEREHDVASGLFQFDLNIFPVSTERMPGHGD